MLCRPGGEGYALRMTSKVPGKRPSSAATVIISPSKRNTMVKAAAHNRVALEATASKTGCRSVGELEMTRRISLVAFSRSRLSARSFSSSRCPAVSFFGDLRTTGRRASTLAFSGFAPRRMDLSLPLTGVTTAQRSRAGYVRVPSWASRMAGSSMMPASVEGAWAG